MSSAGEGYIVCSPTLVHHLIIFCCIWRRSSEEISLAGSEFAVSFPCLQEHRLHSSTLQSAVLSTCREVTMHACDVTHSYVQPEADVAGCSTAAEFAATSLAKQKATLEAARSCWPGTLKNSISSCCATDGLAQEQPSATPHCTGQHQSALVVAELSMNRCVKSDVML